ncbi:heme lyase CcmF/NrfE family subunit [Calderihabitans maritimus]|uniref:Cytochrome c assembly protein n=1 Tax=Calderihabitans maritimus TaxID=1246530 RepID=A0A1Z5HW21_9FIRM|nr:heme lyase CcmF/NrfE family subunit [Calderihabitans maritimus]GAW93736.1 cytochrome c assembly protein [Calderihabitans maritimus]
MAELGYLSLILAIGVSIYAVAGYIISIKTQNERLMNSAKGGVMAVAFLTTVASLILIYLLITSNFQIKYVYHYTSKNLPVFYKFAAFWAGNAGSMLLWAWVLAIYTAIVAYSKKNQELETTPYATTVLLINNLFFLLLLAFVTNPFEKWPGVPPEGSGLNPMLQNPGMVFHPVTLYLGYVGFAVPYAFAMAALITRKVDDTWIKITRRWTVIAWMFLSLGNLYGGQWAYVELGWGGYWGWDPVENASFIPWLTGTAFLHSVMIQERKDMLKIWNMALIIVTFALTIFGTFMVRSGVFVSVHSFANSSLGTWFLAFLGIILVVSLYLLVDRINLLKEGNEFESYISRESSFLLNNLLLVGSAFAVFWGTVFPIISEAVRGVKVTVSVPFFNQVNAPILLAMLFVMGVCPLIAWQKSSLKNLKDNFLYPVLVSIIFGVVLYFLLPVKRIYPIIGFSVSFFVLATIFLEFYRGVKVRHRMTGENYLTALWRLSVRNRRRYGGYIVHLGIVIIAFGIIASHAYKLETTQTVTPGEQITLGKYTMTYQGLRQRYEGENAVVYAEMPVTKDGKYVGTIAPEKIFYKTWDQPSTEVAIMGSLTEDLYVVLASWDQGGKEATFEVHVNPLVSWIWIGGYVLILGTIFAVWPGRGSELGPKYSRGVGRYAVKG